MDVPEYIFSPSLLGSANKTLDKLDSDDSNSLSPPVVLIRPLEFNFVNIHPRVNNFSILMRSTLANSIGLGHIPIIMERVQPHQVIGSHQRYYNNFTRKIFSKFQLKVYPVYGDGNCLYRTISDTIFGTQTHYRLVKEKLISTFLSSAYKETLMAIRGFNDITFFEHINRIMKPNEYGTDIELAMLCLLAGIDVFSIFAIDADVENWACQPVITLNEEVMGLAKNPVFENNLLVVVIPQVGK